MKPVGRGKATRGIEPKTVKALDEKKVVAWMKQSAAKPFFGASARRSASAAWTSAVAARHHLAYSAPHARRRRRRWAFPLVRRVPDRSQASNPGRCLTPWDGKDLTVARAARSFRRQDRWCGHCFVRWQTDMKPPLLRAGRVRQEATRVPRERVLVLVAIACVLIGCVQTQRVTLVAGTDPDAAACFEVCEGSSSCARACPGVIVEDGDCQGRSQRTCVAGREVDGVGTTALVVGLGVLAIAGLMSLTMSVLTPTI